MALTENVGEPGSNPVRSDPKFFFSFGAQSESIKQHMGISPSASPIQTLKVRGLTPTLLMTNSPVFT